MPTMNTGKEGRRTQAGILRKRTGVLKDVDSGKKSGKSKSVAKSPSDLDLSGLLRLLSQRYGKKASLEKVKNTLDKLPIKTMCVRLLHPLNAFFPITLIVTPVGG